MNRKLFHSTTHHDGTARRATEVSRASSYLVFEIAGQPYACPISKIRHLLLRENASVTPAAAGAATACRGILSRQDKPALPIVALRTLWELPELEPQEVRKKETILVLECAGQEWALLVDQCQCVLSNLPVNFAQFRLPPALKGPRGGAFDFALSWRQALLVVLEPDELFQLAAAHLTPSSAVTQP